MQCPKILFLEILCDLFGVVSLREPLNGCEGDLQLGDKKVTLNHLSNEKNPRWSGYIGDDKLPNYIGIIVNHYNDPY